jgi:uncharacterized membrane protein YcaP (DUF421 family)
MDFLWKTDWVRLFTPEMSLLEILIRGTLIYLAVCLLLRFVLKRQAGEVSLTDLLVVTLVAGVCRNPLVKDAYSVTDGVLVVATVLWWSFALDWLSYYVPCIHWLLHPPPVLLIRDGQVLKENLQHELMTDYRLRSKLRRKGVKDPAEVAEAWMEGDGHVSVIKKPQSQPEQVALERDGPASGSDHQGNGRRPAADEQRNGVAAEPSSQAADEVRTFLEAARKLEERVALDQQAIAEHQRYIAEIQEALGRFGFRLKSSAHARQIKKGKVIDQREAGRNQP